MRSIIFLFLLVSSMTSCLQSSENQVNEEKIVIVDGEGEVLPINLGDASLPEDNAEEEDCDEKAKKQIEKIVEDPSLEGDGGCTLD